MKPIKQTAIVYCQDQLGLVDGKTTDALIRHSELFTILGVIDRTFVGKDAGEVLGLGTNHIPIFANLEDALAACLKVPDCYIYGKAPLEAFISDPERALIIEAMKRGMDIVNGLHQFFSEDPEFAAIAAQYNVRLKDIRKPPALKDLNVYTGSIAGLNIPVVAVLGTDCACGKMTTAVALNQALNALGIKSVLVATGQTSLMQGAAYGVSMDALISQFVIGEIEHAVLQAAEIERPDIILVEGQSAVSHPAFMSSIGILKGSLPDGIILQHPPARTFRCDFPKLPMPTVASEIKLIESIAPTKVMAIALSHENLSEKDILALIKNYEQQFQLPTTDVLNDGCHKLIQALGQNFPNIDQKLKDNRLEKVPALAMK